MALGTAVTAVTGDRRGRVSTRKGGHWKIRALGDQRRTRSRRGGLTETARVMAVRVLVMTVEEVTDNRVTDHHMAVDTEDTELREAHPGISKPVMAREEGRRRGPGLNTVDMADMAVAVAVEATAIVRGGHLVDHMITTHRGALAAGGMPIVDTIMVLAGVDTTEGLPAEGDRVMMVVEEAGGTAEALRPRLTRTEGRAVDTAGIDHLNLLRMGVRRRLRRPDTGTGPRLSLPTRTTVERVLEVNSGRGRVVEVEDGTIRML